ncbi:hypothetical protein AAC387_Pa05g0027 [Persea americana]
MGGYPSARRVWSLSASAGSATARDGSESAGDRGRSGNSWMSSGSEADSFSGWLDKDSEDSELNRGFQGTGGSLLLTISLYVDGAFGSEFGNFRVRVIQITCAFGFVRMLSLSLYARFIC